MRAWSVRLKVAKAAGSSKLEKPVPRLPPASAQLDVIELGKRPIEAEGARCAREEVEVRGIAVRARAIRAHASAEDEAFVEREHLLTGKERLVAELGSGLRGGDVPLRGELGAREQSTSLDGVLIGGLPLEAGAGRRREGEAARSGS